MEENPENYGTLNENYRVPFYITALKGANIREEDWREATEEEKNAFEETINAEHRAPEHK